MQIPSPLSAQSVFLFVTILLGVVLAVMLAGHGFWGFVPFVAVSYLIVKWAIGFWKWIGNWKIIREVRKRNIDEEFQNMMKGK